MPRLSSLPPMSMDVRATAVGAAVQNVDFPESLQGVLELLQQTREVLTGVTPPLLRRMHSELSNLTRPIAANQPAEGPRDTPQQRVELQAQIRQLSFGLRRTGDSLRGLATLLEALQVDPHTGAASLLILPPHLQPGRQVAVGSAPLMQMVPNQIQVQGPNGPLVLNIQQQGPLPGQAPLQHVHFMQQQAQQAVQQQQAQQQPGQQQQAPSAAAAAQPAVSPIPQAAAAPAPAPAAAAPAPAAAPAAAAAAPVNPIMQLLQQFQQPQAQAGQPGAPAPAFDIMSILQQAGQQPSSNPRTQLRSAIFLQLECSFVFLCCFFVVQAR